MERQINVYISYFYQIRFFPPTLVPISTAMWDPKWYHEFKDQNHIYIDKHGVINGIRLPIFSPYKVDTQGFDNCLCVQCIRSENERHPESCEFIKKYREQLYSEDNKVYMDALSTVAIESRKLLELPDWPDLCLIVHEAPENKCSEREVLLEMFPNKLGINLTEWKKNDER